ncbi:hypothetical protein DFJ77DRAFT_455517 [Powellomyces hirtus]|nr:hypothetical protein DFJ77DRAFT_455517 [Powellomyces hirtus]
MADTTSTSPVKKRPPQPASDAAPAKRTKLAHDDTAHHHPSCKDSDCKGCESGELEISFVNGPGAATAGAASTPGAQKNATPSAADLYRMALEERDHVDATEETTDAAENGKGDAAEVDHADPDVRRKAVTRLFEMAVEKFEAETGLPKETASERGSNPAAEAKSAGLTSSSELASKFMFASCLLDFGCYFPVLAYIERSAEIYAECVAFLEGASGKAFQDSWGASAAQFGLGRANMELLRCRYEQLNASDSDDEDADGKEDSEAQKESNKEDDNMVQIAEKAIAKGLASVQSDKEAFVLQCITAARLFRDYAVLQRQRYQRGHGGSGKNFLRSFKTALAYLDRAEVAFASSISSDAEALGIRGACLFYTTEHTAHEEQEARKEAADDKEVPANPTTISDLVEAEKCLRLAVSMGEKAAPKDPRIVQNLHLLGQTLLLHSSIDPDENVTVSLFDEAVGCLRKAFELDPDNEEVEEQLEQMGILDEEDAGDESESIGSESENEPSADEEGEDAEEDA